MSPLSEQRDAPELRLSSPCVRRLLGGAAAIAVGLAAYGVFGPLSDQRAWQLAGVHDAGISGAARHAIRLGAVSTAGEEVKIGSDRRSVPNATGPHRGFDTDAGAS